MTRGSEPLLKVEGLTKSFGGLMAVHDLEFQVEEGEIIGLIGPNGSGKTTTLNLLTGFLKPDSGTITFRDMNVTGLPRHRMGPKGMARTFQLTKTFFDFTALENVMVGRVYGRNPAKSLKAAREESLEILERVGLADKAEVVAKDLTLMQRKMLELARALAVKPELLLLDELMAGLNAGETEEACHLIREIREWQYQILQRTTRFANANLLITAKTDKLQSRSQVSTYHTNTRVCV